MEYKERETIRHRDWRLQAITTLAEPGKFPGGILLPIGTPLELVGFASFGKEYITLQVRNAAALYLNIAMQAKKEFEVLKRNILEDLRVGSKGFYNIPTEKEVVLFKCLEQSAICIIFSFTSLEAFCNLQIPDDFEYKQERNDSRCLEIYKKEQIKRFIHIDTKLGVILPQIHNLETPKGKKVWNEYIWLRNLRDRIVHLKSSDTRNSSPEEVSDYVWALLFEDKIKKAPEIAVNLMKYFCQTKLPRWLVKCPINNIES